MEIILPPPPSTSWTNCQTFKSFNLFICLLLLNVNHYFCFESSLPRKTRLVPWCHTKDRPKDNLKLAEAYLQNGGWLRLWVFLGVISIPPLHPPNRWYGLSIEAMTLLSLIRVVLPPHIGYVISFSLLMSLRKKGFLRYYKSTFTLQV